MKPSNWIRAAACGAFALAAAVPAAHAAYVLTSQSVGFAVDAVDGASSFTFRITGAPGATGDWATATHLGAFQFQGGSGLGVDWGQAGVSATAFYEPGGPDVGGVNLGLNNGGCGGGSPSHAICFDWRSAAMPGGLLLTNDMRFTITITGAVLDLDTSSRPHLKLNFSGASGATIGDLLSRDMIWEPNGGGSVPVPGSLALAGLALVALGLAGRRRRG